MVHLLGSTIVEPTVALAKNNRTAPAEPSVAGWQGSKAGDLKVFRIGNQELRFRWCPAGSFRRVSLRNEMYRPGDGRQVDVTLSHGYWMLETEVTQGLWQTGEGKQLDWSKGEGPNLPVYNVCHDEAEAFCARLTELLRQGRQLPIGFKISLPTEAEWEYAARAGSITQYLFGEEVVNLGEYAWYAVNSEGKPHEVKTRRANPWGLCDMLGNVSEWCADGFLVGGPRGVDPFVLGAPARSLSFSGGPPGRVIRGGSWRDAQSRCRPADRNQGTPAHPYDDVGFRVSVVEEMGRNRQAKAVPRSEDRSGVETEQKPRLSRGGRGRRQAGPTVEPGTPSGRPLSGP